MQLRMMAGGGSTRERGRNPLISTTPFIYFPYNKIVGRLMKI